MPFGIAVAVFVVCTAGAVIFFSLYRRRKKPLFSILAVVATLLSIAALVYSGLVLLLVTVA